mgnify:FL=1
MYCVLCIIFIYHILFIYILGKIQCKQTDLEDQGELGHGTCGQVFTMLHKQTGKIMAVKVSL